MRYVAAYLLANLGGSENPSNAELEKILSSVGVEINSERLKQIVKELNGKSVEELIKEGCEKLSAMPVGGGAAVAVAPSPGEPVAAGGGDKKETKKEEKKEESESDDDDMGFGLFE